VTKIQKRIISALVLVPPVLFSTYMGGIIFAALLFVVFVLALWEWRQMSVRTSRPNVFMFSGLLYFAVSFLAFFSLREMSELGLMLTVVLFFSIWSSDSFAYIFGKILKGPKLVPSVSPSKTIAGFIGAAFGSALMFVLGQLITSISFSLPTTFTEYLLVMTLGAVLGMVAQAGDLMMSMMKRYVDVKDTGHIIPGHGGVLDRIDSLLLTAPVFYLIVAVFYNG